MTVTTLAIPSGFVVERIDYPTDANAIIIYFKAAEPTPEPPPPPIPDPVPQLRQIFVMVAGINLRYGMGTNTVVIRQCEYGEVFNVFETFTDPTGKEWVRVGENQWLCRYIPGGNPPEKARYL
jgi:hypothetical protein